MTTEEAVLGARVRTLVEFQSVSVGTEGIIDEVMEDTGLFFMVAWDLEANRLPPLYQVHDYSLRITRGLLRDGFDAEELEMLDLVRGPLSAEELEPDA